MKKLHRLKLGAGSVFEELIDGKKERKGKR